MAEQVGRAHVRRLSICQPFHGGVFRPLHDDGLFEHNIVRRKELNLFPECLLYLPRPARIPD